MNTLYVFPGQGSQYEGMGRDLCEAHAIARDIYDRANEVLGYDIKDMSFNNPGDELNLTRNTQPALLTHHIACLEVFRDRTGGAVQPTMAAGHSLGEYSALVAANAMTFETALKLVQTRGALMGEHGQGEMTAFMLALDDIKPLAEEFNCAISACNQPKQTVVGGSSADLEKLEARVAEDSRALIKAEGEGVVAFVDANRITIKYNLSEDEATTTFDSEVKTYDLTKFRRTNQDTCINLRPIVFKNQKIKKGQVLCEGYATEKGELALGRNLMVAFMPWQGYNFEDAIVVSERVVRNDVFTSIHIEEFELEVRDTKRGEEELTSEIPNVSEEAVKHLDENGIIRIGAEVMEGDILVGKITPKGETDPTPEEKLLRAIFGDKAGDVKDASLRASPSLEGVVIETKLFARPKKDKELRAKSKKEVEILKNSYSKELLALRATFIDKLSKLLEGKVCQGVKHKFGDEIMASGVKFSKENIEANFFPEKNIYRDESTYNVPEEVNLISDLLLDNWTDDKHTNELIVILVKNFNKTRNEIAGTFKREKFTLEVGDE